MISFLYNLFQIIDAKPNSKTKDFIIITRKENCRPISLINIDGKILSTISHLNSTMYKSIIHHEQLEFIPGIPGCSTFTDQLMQFIASVG
jgi:hypothetical protein